MDIPNRVLGIDVEGLLRLIRGRSCFQKPGCVTATFNVSSLAVAESAAAMIPKRSAKVLRMSPSRPFAASLAREVAVLQTRMTRDGRYAKCHRSVGLRGTCRFSSCWRTCNQHEWDIYNVARQFVVGGKRPADHDQHAGADGPRYGAGMANDAATREESEPSPAMTD